MSIIGQVAGCWLAGVRRKSVLHWRKGTTHQQRATSNVAQLDFLGRSVSGWSSFDS
jgi:hypothetical protein